MTVTVRLELDHSQTAGSVEEILDSLSSEEKAKIARQYIKQWFEEPAVVEREAYLEQYARTLLDEKTYNQKPKYQSLADAKVSSDYRAKERSFVSMKERTVLKIFNHLAVIVEEEIQAYLKDSNYFKKIVTSLTSVLSQQIHQYMLNAMAKAVTSRIGSAVLTEIESRDNSLSVRFDVAVRELIKEERLVREGQDE